ncbi:polysaccharide pyruvyl transferase family protein [Plebeiibacterium marinum]|uniref:Polysaccharide pyruvyl transferase family protein n=1 Tax=Plebeiibacterium marinum TaxID=2992111 RepID=A0AAE3MHH6_9BACT|nr:polysaccharide pyruvyl transferase family protein [Plebeiobacterium marinum]MCW3807586.1 polysaccharide pyruvyl transferase family protein [Plebeiobacterium marinum]
MQKIIITGGNFINKGAQSMLFCLVDSLKKNFPGANIVMIDLFPTLTDEDKEKYDFQVVNMHIRTVLRMAFPFIKLVVKPKPISNDESEIKKHFKTADLILDISGYGVSSHNQSPLWTYATLFPVMLAKRSLVPFVFLPQSIGPFDFKGWKKLVIWPLVKKYLKYAKVIFIREPECRKYVEKVRKDEIVDSFDLVLQSPKIELKNIYKDLPKQKDKELRIKKDSVVVIPNKQLTKLKSSEEVIAIFKDLILDLLSRGEEVAIVRHSSDDKQLCDSIYREVSHQKLQLVNEDLSPYDIQQVLESSKVVVAARYHGLIHALKLEKPCLVIGWANKYSHVMKSFGLSNYQFDISQANIDGIIDTQHRLIENKDQITKQIAQKLQEVNTVDIYKYFA